ncbi:hypothetical protein E4U55_000334 [Claviceps digitariae]|nr:hypothetical protein E4U55_000334 [Claviceps digitariae]
MDLTIPTPEGPFESIIFLGDRMDWPVWYDDVTDIARALGIWKYVNPESQVDVREPAKPTLPTRPDLKSVVKREQFETDKTFDVRVEHERLAHALAVREYDILCEQYRIDAARYLADLAEYTTSKDQLQKLYRIIYRSIPDRYRAYLKLDAATTPRAMILSLRRRITPPPDKDRAQAALRTYNSKLNWQPNDDKHVFIEAIARTTVELHRFKGDRFDEGTAVKDLLRCLQVLDQDFAETWLKKEGRRAVLDIVEDYKYRVRQQEGWGHLPLGHWLRGNNIPSDEKVSDPKNPSESVQKPLSVSTVVNGHQNGSHHDVPAPSRSNGKNNGTESLSHQENGVLDWSEEQDQIPVPVFKYNNNNNNRNNNSNSNSNNNKNNNNNNKADLAPTSPAHSTFTWSDPPKPARNGAKKTSDSPHLVMRDCPGCELRHLIRDDAWWENCYVYWEIKGVGNIPDHFRAQERRVELATSRLKERPDESRRAEQWASTKRVEQWASGNTGRPFKKAGNTNGNGNANGNANANGSHHGKAAAGRHDGVSHRAGSVVSNAKSKGKGKGKGKGKTPQAQSQTEEFNLW